MVASSEGIVCIPAHLWPKQSASRARQAEVHLWSALTDPPEVFLQVAKRCLRRTTRGGSARDRCGTAISPAEALPICWADTFRPIRRRFRSSINKPRQAGTWLTVEQAAWSSISRTRARWPVAFTHAAGRRRCGSSPADAKRGGTHEAVLCGGRNRPVAASAAGTTRASLLSRLDTKGGLAERPSDGGAFVPAGPVLRDDGWPGTKCSRFAAMREAATWWLESCERAGRGYVATRSP